MTTIKCAVVVIVMLAAQTTYSSGYRSGEASTVLTGLGVWTLENLGGRTVTWSGTERSVELASYVIPQDSAQGAGGWSRVRLHFAVEVKGIGPGIGYLSLTEGDYGLGSIRFLTRRLGDTQYILWDTVDVQNGTSRFVTLGQRVTGYYENFLPAPSATAGKHRLMANLQEYGQVSFKRAVVYGDTAIVRDRRGPPGLSVEVSGVGAVETPPGQFQLDVVVRNSGGFAAHGVSVVAAPAGDDVSVVGEDSVTVPQIINVARLSFRFQATRPGEHIIDITARADSGGSAKGRVSVTAAADTGFGFALTSRASEEPSLTMR